LALLATHCGMEVTSTPNSEKVSNKELIWGCTENITPSSPRGIPLKDKHVKMWVSVCKEIAQASNCPRAKFGALIIDEDSNTLVSSGYNGYLRGGPPLCGGDVCKRTEDDIESGCSVEIGCVHAEMNALINCARETVSCLGKSIFVNGEPCRMCAKLMVQAGIERVYIIGGVYGNNGLEVLHEIGVEVIQILEEGEGIQLRPLHKG